MKNDTVQEETAGSGEITLTVHRDRRGLLARLLMKFFNLPEKKKIMLDERGSFIWKLCDGKTPVREMIRRFAESYTLNRKETEVLIVYYLKSLARRGLAGIIVKREENGKQ
ncbi:PqqD family protein [Planctomycetota bacterium]